MLFSDLPIIEPILRAINEEGYKNPTPIQEKSIPIVGRLKNEAVIPVAEHVQESIKEEIKSTVENAESNVSSSVSMKIITRPTVQANQTVVVAQVPTVEVPKTEPSIPVVETLPKVEEGIQ